MSFGDDGKDLRSTKRPADTPPEEGSDPGDEGEGHGPLGNPASDEETLRHRQQERDRSPRGDADDED
jgi:hypothetical protein